MNKVLQVIVFIGLVIFGMCLRNLNNKSLPVNPYVEFISD